MIQIVVIKNKYFSQNIKVIFVEKYIRLLLSNYKKGISAFKKLIQPEIQFKNTIHIHNSIKRHFGNNISSFFNISAFYNSLHLK